MKGKSKSATAGKKRAAVVAPRRLVDRLVARAEDGALQAILATTYELQSEFLETDFLPSLLGLGAWDDRKWTSRIAIEKSLAETEAAAIFMDASCYRGRPRSLRLTVHPICAGPSRILHAKVTLLVHANAVRLLVGSANLTEPGYRKNREVAVSLRVTADDARHAGLIRAAIAGLRPHLAQAWDDAAERAVSLASQRLQAWVPGPAPDATSAFVWSGADDTTPLWRQVVERWPREQQVHAITIVSPFWSEDAGDGPLSQLLRALAERDALGSNVQLRLLTEARPLAGGTNAPVLPLSYRTWRPSTPGVVAVAAPVDPSVLPEEVDGMEDFRGTRRLHAKVLLLEGEHHALGYVGSANFTQHGWGFARGLPANLEAGIVSWTSSADRATLQALVPKAGGSEVTLDGAAGDRLELLSGIEPPPPWPAFVRDICLVVDGDHLALEIATFGAEVEGDWVVALLDEGATVLGRGAVDGPAHQRIVLAAPTLERLLVDQEVAIHWWASAETVRFPVNVAPDARDQLPIAPGSTHPGEGMLLAYYQGKVTWDALYPEPAGATHAGMGSTAANGSAVDTSRIQAYQIREFVEALQGIRADLVAAASSPGTMRLAIRGPVSPLALARHVEAAVRTGDRTPTAGAFQLVELLACLDQAARVDVQRDAVTWRSLLTSTRADIEALLAAVQQAHPADFPADGPFRRFHAMLDRHHRPEGA